MPILPGRRPAGWVPLELFATERAPPERGAGLEPCLPPPRPNARPIRPSPRRGAHRKASDVRPEATLGPPACARGTAPSPQAGLLTPGSPLPEPSQDRGSQWHLSGSLPGHSGATVPDSHRLPFSAPARMPSPPWPPGVLFPCRRDSRRTPRGRQPALRGRPSVYRRASIIAMSGPVPGIRFPTRGGSSARLAEPLAGLLLALGGQILDLHPLWLAALTVHIGVLFPCAAIAAPALVGVELHLRHGASLLSTCYLPARERFIR